MLTGANPGVTLPRRLPKEPKQSADLLEHLRLIARQHQVCYEIWPVWSTGEGETLQKGFVLLLCGVNGHVIREKGGLHSVPCCQHCAHTYSELHELAEWILHLRKQPSRYKIYPFDRALHMAPPHRHHRNEIVITTTILAAPQGHKAEDYRCESECLKEVRKRLSKLGIQEDVLYHPAAKA
jgi:hypothetical protein